MPVAGGEDAADGAGLRRRDYAAGGVATREPLLRASQVPPAGQGGRKTELKRGLVDPPLACTTAPRGAAARAVEVEQPVAVLVVAEEEPIYIGTAVRVRRIFDHRLAAVGVRD